MNKYECIYVARQDIPPTQVENMSEQFTTIIKDYNGNIQKVEYCGLRQLAYKIKKNRKGHYVEMHLEAVPDAIIEMERQMGLHEDMLRFLTLRVKEFAKGPSPLSQTKGFKESRRMATVTKEEDTQEREGV
jgi:small subunit ribosomal protein S6